MLKPKQTIEVDHGAVIVIRKDRSPHRYLPTRSSLKRLNRAITQEANKLYGPRITFHGHGFAIEW